MGKKKEKKGCGSIFLTILFLIIIIFGAFFGYRVYENGGDLRGLLMTIFGQTPKTLENLETMNVLVLRYK